MARFDNTIKKMQDITSDINKVASEKIKNVDEETALKIKTISDKTIDTITEASVKLKSEVDRISDEEELDKFLDRVEEKCNKAAAYAFAKFEEIAPSNNAEYIKIQEEESASKSTMEKFLENENVKNATNMAINLKNNVVDFINSEETQKTIYNVKKSALTIADKGLDAIIKVLDKTKDSLEKTNNNLK